MKRMTVSIARVITFLTVLLFLLISCGQADPESEREGDQAAIQGQASSSDAQGSAETRLLKALRMVDMGALGSEPATIGFTDWTRVKENMGMADLDGSSSDDMKRDFVINIGENQTYGAGEWVGNDSYRDTWGFDVEWELEGESFGILKFKDGFDFEAWKERLLGGSYSEGESYQGAVVLSTEDLSVPFHRHNVVYLPEENILVLSEEARSKSTPGALDIVDWIKGGDAGPEHDQAVLAAAEQLGDVAAALISLNRCSYKSMHLGSYFGDWAVPPAVVDNVNEYLEQADLEALLSIHDYEVFGMGYRQVEGQPFVFLVYRYNDPAEAEADLALRRDTVANGPSFHSRLRSFADLHAVTDGYVEGSNLVLKLRPTGNNPSLQFEMVGNREPFLSMCSG